jgi:hypothetical protein
MRRPLIRARDIKVSLDKGNKLKEGHGGLPRKRIFFVCMRRRKKEDEEV